MSEKSIEKLDKFTKKMVSELPQEQPSSAFHVNVMDAINALETSKKPVYQPLISKKVLYFIGFSIIALTILLWNNTSGESSLLSAIDLSKYTSAVSFEMPATSFTVSNVTVYGFIFLAIMITIQIGYIKNYYNSRYN